MITAERFFGDAHGQALSLIGPSLTLPYRLVPARWRLYTLRVSGAGFVTLPSPSDAHRMLGAGRVLCFVWNASNPGANTIEIRDDGGSPIVTLDVDEIAKVRLGRTGGVAGTGDFVWDVEVRARLT